MPVTVRATRIERRPAEAVIEAAAGAMLLVVDRSGHGGSSDLLRVGSVATACVGHAPCPWWWCPLCRRAQRRRVPIMARVPYIDPETAPPATAAVLANLPRLHVFGLLAQAETAFTPWLRFGGAVLSDLALDPLLRELTILQVGRLAARYEWEQHVPIAKEHGATDEQIAALEAGDIEHASFSPVQRALLAFVADMVRDGEVPDDRYAALAAGLDDRRVVEVALTAGHYLGLARMMTALRIDSDVPAPSGWLNAAKR